MERAKRPTIYDVAHRAGVSTQTVSRVLNSSIDVRDSTRDRVCRAIDELQYRPSGIAQALASNRASRVGVIIDSADHFGPMSTLLAVQHAARQADYSVTVFSMTGPHESCAEDAIKSLKAAGADALVFIAPRFSSLEAFDRLALHLPTVVVGDLSSYGRYTTVAIDQSAGVESAFDHLVSLGHRSILHLAGPLDWTDALSRERAWRRHSSTTGLLSRMIVGDWSSDFGFEVGSHPSLLRDVTAVLASNDQVALGLIHGLWERGIRVPEDISIVGYDDQPESAHMLPPLTTVRQNFHGLGIAAMRAVVELTCERRESEDRRISPELIVRDSTRAVT